MMEQRFQGIYPARVESNFDPKNMARIQVSIADVGGRSISTWAKPCLPVTGTNAGMYTVPPKGAAVWVQFVRGNADEPVWLGGYFSEAEAPQLQGRTTPGLDGITLQTTGNNGLVISDGPNGGILIKTAGGSKIEISDLGITISAQGAEIKLSGGTVSINNNALTIT
jgi:uncharacterized protein involved in type VI secretion and phage assembly